jgi:hypothetical protein
MKTRLLALLFAVACSGITVAATAPLPFVTSERAIEATSGSLVLPEGPGSTLLVTPCPGCVPKSMSATATTTYYLKRQQVLLPELKTALAGKPDVYVSVFQSTKTGALTRVVAALDPPVPANKNAAATQSTPAPRPARAVKPK